jgi:serine phosphatase RsbU (regulator of sigma subunit)/catechol 2,3-dioxygenase-like lactoylglutathione lyase family enzyme
MADSASSRPAQPSAGASHPARAYLRLQSINVYVRDQQRSLEFYRDELGFDVAFDVRLQSGERWLAVSPPDGTAILALIAPRPDSREYKLIGRSTHVAFITDDVAAKFQEWVGRGVRFQTAPRLRRIKYDRPSAAGRVSGLLGQETPVWGGTFARFRDIDGNSFTLVSFDEVTHALEAQRRAAAARVEAERRSAQEIEFAKQVQARLFPQHVPPLRTLDYAGLCIQALEVGGDYYDFLDLGRERLGLVISDISGKGMAAALLMANLQANLRSQCAVALDQPERLLQSVNQLFCQNAPDNAYATLLFAEYDDQSRRLRYANCGHHPALLLRHDGAIERLDATGTVLGLFREWECTVGERELAPGDTLALYTDGITESFDGSGQEFGECRLVDSLRQHRDLPSRALVDRIVADVRRFSRDEQRDDITLIVAKSRAG